MSKATVIALIIVFLLCLALTGTSNAAERSSQYAINWSVVGSGGAPMRSTNYGLDSTAGEPVTGHSGSTHYDLCAGYWCGMAVRYRVCLPLVLRDA